MIPRMIRQSYFLTLCLAFVASGCSSDRLPLGQVSGTVTLDGVPLENAFLEFQPTNGRSSLGITDSAGHYNLNYDNENKGALIGSHKIFITTQLESKPVGESGEPAVVGRKELLPSRYHSNSELTADVKSGKNAINFDLTTKK